VSHIKLILTESVHSLGEAGDLVSVKPGYARNFLLRRGKAIVATESRVQELEHHKRIVAEKAARAMKDLQATKKALEAVRIEITARAGDAGKLFGSVTSAQIAEKLAAQGFEIDRRRIELRDPIKEVGEHAVPVKLHREIVAKIAVTVIGEAGPPPEEELEEEPAGNRRRSRDDDREPSRSDDDDEDE
jgi:large subunit ribosomal protein L9